ncbi:MAG TPA: preprotein translocase subunit YajC [Isosphaeraceae bacterium]|nr:preprotein translocase subunit YajC [Isosphaeraceae bacterium]
MPGPLAPIVPLFAEAPKAAPAQDPTGSLLGVLLPLIPIFVLYYFLFIRPQQAQEKKRRSQLEGLRKNDRVVTIGGVYGTVVSVDLESDRVMLRVDDDKGVKIAVTKASVARILGDPEKDKDREKTATASSASAD